MSIARIAVVVLVAVALGCAGGVSGTIDGTSVPAFSSSALVNAEIESFPDIDQVVARFASFGPLCELWAADMDIQNGNDSSAAKANDREDLYQERAPQN